MKRTIHLDIDARTLADAARDRFLDCAQRLQLLANRYLTEWERSHERAGDNALLAEWAGALRDWHRADKKSRGAKPKCPAAFDDQELRKWIYNALNESGLFVHSRLKDLLQNWLRKTMTTSSSGFPKWINALLYRDRLSRFTHPLPIPLGSRNCAIEVREAIADGKSQLELWCTVRVDRTPKESGPAGSHQDEFRLIAGGKARRYADPVWRIAQQEQPIVQSAQLIYREDRRKWRLAVCVDLPDPPRPAVDAEKTLIVYPSEQRPLKIRVDGRTRPVTGKGHHVAMRRGSLQKQRRARQENYRTGIGAGKGRGRRRAIESWDGKLMRTWRNFGKINNNIWSKSVVEAAVKAGAGTIIVIQPCRGDRFLDVAGNIFLDDEGRTRTNTGWAWFELSRMISDKANVLGVKTKVVKELRERRRVRKLEKRAG